MRTPTIILATAIALMGPRTTALAQNSAVDIGLYEGENDNLEVRVIPHTDFDGVFSSLVFTLRWERSTQAELAEPIQPALVASYMPVRPSGPVHEEGTYNYQIYSGIGLEAIADGGSSWVAGKEYLIAEIPMMGRAKVELLNDTWTDDIHNNGGYYISLGGLDRTGAIVKSLATGGRPDFDFSVLPNPNNGRFTLTVNIPEESDLAITLVSSSGRTVLDQQNRNASGTFRKEVDLSGFSTGVYYLKLVLDGRTIIKKVIFQ